MARTSEIHPEPQRARDIKYDLYTDDERTTTVRFRDSTGAYVIYPIADIVSIKDKFAKERHRFTDVLELVYHRLLQWEEEFGYCPDNIFEISWDKVFVN